MKLWKKIVLGLGISLVCGYLLFSLVYFGRRHAEPPCEKLVIEITDDDNRQFVSVEEITSQIQRANLSPEGEAVDADRCHEIEENALENKMVRTAECYSLSNGDVKLVLTQRCPTLRICGKSNYYVDSDRKIMPQRSSTASDVMVVTGDIKEEFAQNELWDFAKWLYNDEFWNAQVEQIDVVTPEEIVLIPRVGSGVILLGSLDNYESKLRKLKILYKKGFSKTGWKDYKEIDLRYKDQIVCR